MASGIEIQGSLLVVGEVISGERVSDWIGEGVIAGPREGKRYLELGEQLYLCPLPGADEETMPDFVVRDERPY